MSAKLAEMFVEIDARDQKLQSAFGRIKDQFGRLGSLMTKFAAAAAAAFAVQKVAGAISDVAESAIDMESRLAQLRKTTGLEGAALESFKRTLVGLSTTMAGTKLDELFDVASMGGRLGVSSDKLAAFTRDIAMVRVALDDIPAEEAATGIARILNVFGKGTEEAIRFASALNKLDDTSTATGRDILDIAGRLSGPASTLGLTPQKVLALAAALKDAGVENEVGGTALAQVFAKMATDAKLFARIAGDSVGAFTKKLRRDPLEALSAFIAGLSQLDSLAQFKALDKLGLDGARVQTTLLQLGKVTGKLGGYVKVAESEWGSLASIMAENAAQGETTRAQIDRMRNSFQATAAKLGGYLLPVIKALANAFGDLAGDIRNALDRNNGPIQAFAQRVASAATRIGLAFTQMPTFLSLARATVQEKLEQVWEVVKRVGARIWGQLTWGAGAAMAFIKSLFNDLASFWSDLFSQIGSNLAAQIRNAITGALPSAIRGPQVVVPPIVARPGLMGDPRRGIGARPTFDAGGILASLPNRQKEIGALNGRLDMATMGRSLMGGASGFFGRPDVGQAVDRLGQGLKGMLGGKGGSLGGAVGNVGESLAKRLGAGQGLGRAIGVALGGLVEGPVGAMAAARGDAPKVGGAGGGKRSPFSEKSGEFLGLADYAKKLQEQIGGGGIDRQMLNVGKEQLAVQKQQLAATRGQRPQAGFAV